MIKELVTYPDERIKITSADVRKFDEDLFGLIDNMKETMEANGLDALAAIQIAVPATVVLIKKEDGELLELVNPRIIHTEGRVESTERTQYLPGIEATLMRYDRIKLIYQDRNGSQHAMDVDGELSIRIQRKIDYTFGGTFVDKLDKKGQRRVEKEAEAQWGRRAESCPTVFYRDYFKKGAVWLMLAVLLSFLAPLIVDETTLTLLYTVDKWMMATVPLLMVGYFFYARYETEKYKQCTSCQTGNIIGTCIVVLAQWLILLAAMLLIFG